ncbi:MAG: DUF222 domain-containing protein [Pseudomonadota bacterium]
MYPSNTLEDEITLIAGHINAIDFYFLDLLSEFDLQEGWCGDGIKSFAHWLNWKCGLGALESREKVRVARALRELPQTREAFRVGEISYSKVRAITRVATADNEAYLLHIARFGTAAHVEKLVRSYRRCRNLNEDRDLADLYRSFGLYQDDDGMYVFRGRLPADEGEVIVQALQHLGDIIWRERQKAAQAVANAPGKSDLQPENVSAETFSGEEEPALPPRQPADFSSTTASALVRLAEHYLATGSNGATTLAGSDRCQLLVHVNLNAANIDTKIEGGVALNTGRGSFLHPELVKKLACDASIRTLLEDDAGQVISIGRKSRIIPRNMAIALKQRDRGCRYPNCHQQHWTDAHHIRHWADGGETSLDNLITLCRFHHTGLHRGDYIIDKQDGEVRFLDRFGHEIQRVIPGLPHDPGEVVSAIQARHAKAGLGITSTTGITRWDGGGMDYGVAIEQLFLLANSPAVYQ